MKCTKCNHKMTLLFTSYVCDWCDGLAQKGNLHKGYAVIRQGRGVPTTGYVFPSEEMAARWVREARVVDGEIKEVACEFPFTWHVSRGTIEGLQLADRLYEIYPDHKFESKENRAYLVSK